MLFIALAKFKKALSNDVVAENIRDIEADLSNSITYKEIY